MRFAGARNPAPERYPGIQKIPVNSFVRGHLGTEISQTLCSRRDPANGDTACR